MAKKNIFKNKSLWKKIGIGVLAGALAIGAIAGISALFREPDPEERRTISASAFSVGGLNNDGTYKETDESIYTRDAFECKGLKITPDFESVVDYQVFFYDYDGDFMSANELTDGKTTETPEFARYCRIVITPEEDDKVSWYEVNNYAKQLTIEVYKEQEFVNPLDINYFEIDAEKLNYMVGSTQTIGSALATTESTATGTLALCKFVNVTSANKVVVKSYSGSFDAWRYAFVDNNGNVVAYNVMSTSEVVDGVAIMEVEVPTGATQFTFTYRQGNSYGIHLI